VEATAPALHVLRIDAVGAKDLLAGDRHERATLVESDTDRLLSLTDLSETLDP
jgi:hypothetical protein